MLTHDHDMERDDLSVCASIIVDIWTTKGEIRGEDENDVENYKRI